MRLLPDQPEGALQDLAALRRLYVVVSRAEVPTAIERPFRATSTPADVYDQLGITPAALDSLFGPPARVASYVASDVYVLEARTDP